MDVKEKLAIKDLDHAAINLGRSSRDEAYEKIAIKIRTEYHRKFLEALNLAREGYKKQSKVEIKIEEDIMGIYKTLIRERADINGIQYSLRDLRELWGSRYFFLKKCLFKIQVCPMPMIF